MIEYGATANFVVYYDSFFTGLPDKPMGQRWPKVYSTSANTTWCA